MSEIETFSHPISSTPSSLLLRFVHFSNSIICVCWTWSQRRRIRRRNSGPVCRIRGACSRRRQYTCSLCGNGTEPVPFESRKSIRIEPRGQDAVTNTHHWTWNRHNNFLGQTFHHFETFVICTNHIPQENVCEKYQNPDKPWNMRKSDKIWFVLPLRCTIPLAFGTYKLNKHHQWHCPSIDCDANTSQANPFHSKCTQSNGTLATAAWVRNDVSLYLSMRMERKNRWMTDSHGKVINDKSMNAPISNPNVHSA